MSVKRIIAIAMIYLVACGGWTILGTTTAFRSNEFSRILGEDVENLWGTPLVQQAPSVSVKIPGSDRVRSLLPEQNELSANLHLDYRKRGLIWYPTYQVHFKGLYKVKNTELAKQKVQFHFNFPSAGATYDEFEFLLDGKPLPTQVNTSEGVGEIVELDPGESRSFTVAYRTRGLESWRYRIDPSTGRVKNLSLTIDTDFSDIDYPEGSYSPTAPAKAEKDGAQAVWQASDLITKQDMGVVVPARINPGPLASRITYFAPVCLIFFFVLISAIGIVRKVDIHPMHYLFVAAGFAAFHVLLAYLVDHINIHLAFALGALVSVGLVTSYMSAALKGSFPWKVAAAGQIFFLVLFSYSFFLQGMTGMVVAVGSVVTLAMLMRITASTDWNELFKKKSDQ